MSAPEGVGTFRRYSFVAELALVAGMVLTMIVPSRLDNILPWYEITFPLYVRAAFWIIGLSLLPGRYLLGVLGLLRHQTAIVRFSVSTVLSIAFVGIITMAVYYATFSLAAVPLALLAATVVLMVLTWRVNGLPGMLVLRRPSQGHLLLLAGVASSIGIAAYVQSHWRYMIYTDFWVSLLSGVRMVSGLDVSSVSARIEYPVGYGYIMAGFSSGAGVPLINTHVLMLPLIALNILVFYSLAKEVFGLSEGVSALASIFFAFGGGLGWAYETFANRGAVSFIYLSGLLKDMYFFPPFWDGIAYQYKLLALLMALAAFITFAQGSRFKGKDEWRGMALTAVSALLFVWAFLIHMLPALMAPVFLALALFNNERRLMLKRFFLLVAFGVALFAAHELLMGGVYIPLIIDKLSLLLSGIGRGQVGSLGIIAVAAAGIAGLASLGVLLLRRRMHASTESKASHPPTDEGKTARPRLLRNAKHAAVLIVAAFYLAGLYFVPSASFTLNPDAPFPWFSYVTRYGGLGVLALLGLALSGWRYNWTRTAIFWSLMAIAMGSVWWGERLNAFLFPALCIFASVGTVKVLKVARSSLLSKSEGMGRQLSRAGAAAAVLCLVVLSFTSFSTGVYWHTQVSMDLVNDDMAESINWIYHDVPGNETILTDDHPTLMFYGFLALADRQPYFNDLNSPNQQWLDPLIQMVTLAVKNVKWAYVNDSLPMLSGTNEFIRGLQYYGDAAFDSGTYSVKSFPIFRLPSQSGGVAVVDKGFLGTSTIRNTFGWLDDSMASWRAIGTQATVDGQVLKLSWNHTSAGPTEISASKTIPAISSNAYPYVLMQYRNGPETSADSNITQLLRLDNSATGLLGYINLPNTQYYQTISFRLPANITIDKLTISMNNVNRENGTIALEVDYVGFSASPALHSGVSPSFLSLAVPSVWGQNYTMSHDFNIKQGATLLVTTYDGHVDSALSGLDGIETAILFHSALYQPPWGENWTPISSAAIQGYYEGKRIIIVNSASTEIVGDLTAFSEWLLQQSS